MGLLIAAALAVPAGTGAAIALADNGGNTSAVAINTKDGSSVFRLMFQIRQVSGSVVDNQNAAVAYSSCTSCQTVAISIQVLLISSDPTVFTPTNEAIAINQTCDMCDTLAAAYQFAVGLDTQLKFTADGRQQIADIRHQLEMLRNSGLTGPEIDAQVNTLMTQLANVLQTQLIAVNQPAGQGASTSSGADTTPSGSTSSTPTTTSGTTPTSTSTTPTGTGTSPATTTTTTPTTTSP
jgi:putative peptide zinc metalloprotease protein